MLTYSDSLEVVTDMHPIHFIFRNLGGGGKEEGREKTKTRMEGMNEERR